MFAAFVKINALTKSQSRERERERERCLEYGEKEGERVRRKGAEENKEVMVVVVENKEGELERRKMVSRGKDSKRGMRVGEEKAVREKRKDKES